MNAPVNQALLAADWRNTIKSLREQFPDADDQTLFDTCDGLTSAADVVAEFVRASIEAEAMAEANRALETRYGERRDLCEARAARLRRDALRLMIDAGMDKGPLRRPEFTLSVSHRSGKPEVYDEEQLPESFFDYETIRKVNRDRIKAAAEAKQLPPGVRMTNGVGVLTVRSK